MKREDDEGGEADHLIHEGEGKGRGGKGREGKEKQI